MTTSALSTDLAASIVSDLGGSGAAVDMMIGIGLNKESDAVFFQYMGAEAQPTALMLPSGKPCTRMAGVKVTGISVVDGVGEFNATKLNIFVETESGHSLMLTSGLTTLWSQYLITGLMGAYKANALTGSITIDTWKGTSKMKPCFAAVRVGREKVQDDDMKEVLLGSKGDRKATEDVLRDAVQIMNHAITGGPVQEAEVKVEEKADF